MRFKIMTYNIHHGTDAQGKASLEKIAGLIRVKKPQLVCLNEVDVRNPRSGFVDQPKWLGEHLKLVSIFGPTIKLLVFGYGNAVLSAYPARMLGNCRLTSSKEPRRLLETEILTPAGPIIMMATHLGLNPVERDKQMNEILSRVRSYKNRPLILAGDFNAEPGELTKISTVLQDTALINGADAEGTFPTSGEAKRIDYIFCSREFEIIGQERPNVNFSDHYPLISELEISEPDFEGID